MHHKFYGEVLPYLEVNKQQNEIETKENIEMPELTGNNLSESKKILKELNLEFEINGEESAESKVIDQLPKKGIQVQEGTKVILYVSE